MLTISKALNCGQAQSYHKLEFTSETQNYYKQGHAVQGEWQGKLAGPLGLTGAVSEEHFTRLAEGKTSAERGAVSPPSDGPGVCQCRWLHNQGGRAPGWLGRDLFRSEIRVAHRARWR